MSYGLDIEIKEDVSQMAAKLGAAFAGDAAKKVMARSGANKVKDHLRGLSRYRHRAGLPFNFYARAADATSSGVQGGNAYVSIDHEGIAMRRYGSGGKISPRRATYFTIPVHPESMGKRVKEFPENELTWILNRRKGTGVVLRQGRVIYALTKQIEQKADTTVIPTDYDLMQHITEDLKKYIEKKAD